MIFSVENGCFSYERDAVVLHEINFQLHGPEIVCILGPNGSGKTTLLKCMLGLLRWQSGASLLDGTDIRNLPHRALWQRVGYVPQAKPAAFSYRVEDMVVLGRSALRGSFAQPQKEDWQAVDRALARVGVQHLKGKLCSQLSGGELQMVLIARALAADPELLVLDEPESNLDFKNQLIVRNTIQTLCSEEGISAIVNTHYPENAIAIAHKALLLSAGGTACYGPASELITAEHLREVFGVDVVVQPIEAGGTRHMCVVPLAVMEDKRDV